jgi:hypothetical protein
MKKIISLISLLLLFSCNGNTHSETVNNLIFTSCENGMFRSIARYKSTATALDVKKECNDLVRKIQL